MMFFSGSHPDCVDPRCPRSVEVRRKMTRVSWLSPESMLSVLELLLLLEAEGRPIFGDCLCAA